MGKPRHTKESIITTLQNLAASLKKETLRKRDLCGVLPTSSVNYYFGSFGNALEAAGLKRGSSVEHLGKYRNELSSDELFLSMLRVEEQLGRVPKCDEYNARGEHSSISLRRRFGSWPETLKHYEKWKVERGVANLECVSEIDPNQRILEPLATAESCEPRVSYCNGRAEPPQLYGEPIDFRGLRHAPINEQGVVYLFGMVSRELGFYIEAVQQGFPDCEGKYLYDAKKNLWAKARIEFEFRASSFKEHGHDPNGCDVVVCWLNDWPECPVRVIELRKEILKLPAG